MKRLNLSRVNDCFFLISIALSVMFTLISAFVFEIDLKSAFLLMLLLSFTADAICFYRLNNGLIAIARKKFGKPSSKNLHFVAYEKNEFEPSPDLKGKSLFVYKLNSRNAYQIIKLKDRFLVHRIYPDREDSKIITDFDGIENLYVNSKDIEIYYSSVKSVIYSLSENNFYLPIISINTGKKHFRYIGCFKELKDNEVKEFFTDKAKVKIKNKYSDRDNIINKQQKSVLGYNVLTLFACTIVPQTIFVGVHSDEGYRHILSSLYILISLVILILYILMPIIWNKKYTFNLSSGSSEKKDISAGTILVFATLLIAVDLKITVINKGWYLILCLVIFILICILYFSKNISFIRTFQKSKYIAAVLEIIFISAFVSSSIILGVNYLVPTESYEQSYNVIDTHIEKRKHNYDYYATVRIGTAEYDIEISEELYDKSPSIVNVKRQKGLLGIEYAYNSN